MATAMSRGMAPAPARIQSTRPLTPATRAAVPRHSFKPGKHVHARNHVAPLRWIVRAEESASGAARGAAAEAALPELLAELRAVTESGEVSEEFAKEFPGELEEALGGLRAARAEAEAGLAALRDQHLRLTADYENFRRRSAAEREAEAGRARAGAVKELLGVVDSFEQAAAAMQPTTDAERAVITAYDAVYRQLATAFRKLGVEAVPGEGAPFDPEVHEAIMREPAPEGVSDGTVLQEFRKGFRLGHQLLRAGMVKVAYTEDGA